MIRYFVTPYSRYKVNSWHAGETVAVLMQTIIIPLGTVLLSLPTGRKYDIFKSHLPLESKTFFFGPMPEGWPKKNKDLFIMILMEQIMALDPWMDTTITTDRMKEKMTAESIIRGTCSLHAGRNGWSI
ncbi:hypothetical protein XENOCAPTIV_022859 [Xenoophorus captivus]|uniref:Uncharacterized protein n=1 Tax=Xenoophorus captivus TaxID=1517983 RepID=A0ABV0QT55_9TELE